MLVPTIPAHCWILGQAAQSSESELCFHSCLPSHLTNSPKPKFIPVTEQQVDLKEVMEASGLNSYDAGGL